MELTEGTRLDPDRIRRQLTRLTTHRLFVRSARVRRFLEFTIEAHLAGNADQLKEYILGVEVFDRPATYDPRIDPIVRVEARRVRAKLRAFYESDGVGDDLIIDYPRGSYVPHLSWRRQPVESQRHDAVFQDSENRSTLSATAARELSPPAPGSSFSEKNYRERPLGTDVAPGRILRGTARCARRGSLHGSSRLESSAPR
jgi:hypothetical protein